MKFLLAAVNAKYIHSNPAIYSLKAYAGKENEQEIETAEYTINNKASNILEDIFKRKPDVTAFSCYIWNWGIIQEIIKELPKILPDMPIWLGGPEVSFGAEEILLQYPFLTGIMRGEGEETFKELFYHYKRCSDRELPEDIAGIIFRRRGRVITTAERALTDLNKLPFLYEEELSFQNRIIYYESARGCPYRCSYCLSAIDKQVRFRDISIVKKELQFFLDHQVRQVKFVDRTFNCNHNHTMEIWEYILKYDNGITNFHFEIAGDIVNEEELQLLSRMRPGLVQLEIGVQSDNEETLSAINRSTDRQKLRQVTERILQGKNIHVHLDLIAGLPYEDYESFGRSFDAVYSMHPHQLQLGFLKVLKGSPIYEKADIYGIKYTDSIPYEVLYSKWLPYSMVCRLKRIEEMVELYYNSNQFTYTMQVLKEKFGSAFAMFEALARYYEEQGCLIFSPSRAYRYQVLLAFACQYDGEKEELYKELLTFDIYLRENLKSRPEFAKDISPYKEKIRAMYETVESKEALEGYAGYSAKQTVRMTHAEVFAYAVWQDDIAARMNKCTKEKAVVFDYQRINPLTGDAAVITADL